MNNKNKLILQWLQDNVSDFVRYYPSTKRVKLSSGAHISFQKLFREVTGTPKATPKATPKSTSKSISVDVEDEQPQKPKRKKTKKSKKV